MGTGDTCVADPLDTVHREIDSVVHGHHVYKSVWSPVTREQLILEKEPANPHNELAAAVKGFSDSGPHSKNLFTDHMVFYYMKGLFCLSYYWEKEERKRLRSTM